jgi:hypothetical protein
METTDCADYADSFQGRVLGKSAQSAKSAVRLLLIVVCALGLFGSVASGADMPPLFREPEQLVYDVTWMGIKAGQATLVMQGVMDFQGQRAAHLVTTAQSTPFISTFYRVNDRSVSYLALDPLRALRFEKHLREGRYRHDSWTDFDHQGKMATFRYLDFSPVPKGISRLEDAERYGKYVTQEFPLTPDSLDEFSVLYYVRTLSLQVGKIQYAKVFASKKNWQLEVRVLGRETLETIFGPRETLVVEPLLQFEGVFQQKGKMTVWLTDDAERIPVMMKSQVKIGSFVSTLTSRTVGAAVGHADTSAEASP